VNEVITLVIFSPASRSSGIIHLDVLTEAVLPILSSLASES
jgi:hypothetical protein